tara:strand:+ start:986 stop:1726 length:741 start_codon:yes stop_codon:yes gene_type:complete
MNKKKLISEELKRHLQLLEYTFYVPEEAKEEDDADLLFDGILNEQDPPEGEETEGGDTEDPFFDPDAVGQTPEGEVETDADPFGAEETTEEDPFADEGEGVEVEDELASEDMGDEETVEVDVTDIVDKTEETKTSVDGINTKMDDLLSKLSDLESQIGGMDQVISKIDGLEKEIEKRNPTPVERLEMRSMNSFPYSVKLTDFWDEQEGYDATEEETEYTLTQSDVDNFDQKEIRSSFNPKDEEGEE